MNLLLSEGKRTRVSKTLFTQVKRDKREQVILIVIQKLVVHETQVVLRVV